MRNKPIINIHTHLVIDIPDAFPNRILSRVANTKVGFKILSSILKNAIPFTENDALDRLLQFIEASKDEDMFSMYWKWRDEGGYSPRTKVVVLTVDMAYMGAGKMKRRYIDTLADLDILATEEDSVIPFLHTDCRRPEINDLFDEFVSISVTDIMDSINHCY